ncbi:hypothetical protein [Mycobacterium sp. 94-17]|uniref:hypothetical protein n=1 Tax=Mycobacterium sp. 94-17 TaxID=2986147 RepID=UPI002D1F6700|nr:hypothetical protein [Mycobacterium sp. 94-17]MEB4211688.1 hypothetical protein [Mycobacterium sp. 94-17]
MQRPLSIALSAATALAVVGLAACSSTHPRSDSSATSSLPAAPSSQVAAPVTTPLPPPEALTDVLARLADPNVPGAGKVNLVEGATPESAAPLDKFTNALRDNGYLPMTFNANDIAWSDKNPSNVKATVAVHTAQANNANFTFPMEFAPFQGGWQLSKQTAAMLLALGKSQAAPTPGNPAGPPAPPPPEAPPAPAPPPASPSPAPPPAPEPAPEPHNPPG